MRKIRIITDSASDIVENKRENLTVLPMSVRFGEEEFFDGVNLSHREFYEKLVECESLPITSLISPAVFEEEFKKAKENDEDVVVITVSEKLSGTCQSARISAEDFENVFVVDSKNASIGEHILVDRAFELIEEGFSAEEISKKLEEEREKIHILALLDTLEYLKKGGRISKTVALVGGMLSIKPVASIINGEVALLGTARGSKNGNNFLIKEIEKTDGIDFSKPLYLGYTGLSDNLLQKYIADSKNIWEGNEKALNISTIGGAIGTHIGPNSIVVAFFSK